MKIPVVKNTITNYLSIFIRLLQGILISRWIIGYLGMAQYGLWTLLWSIFVYSLLLDFGCGVAAQKYTSGGLYERDSAKFSRLQSTIFTFHCLMALVIACVAFGASFFLTTLLRIDQPEQLSYTRICFLMFGFGSALIFPTGIFPEILVGLQKLYIRNYITMLTKSLELVGVLVIFWTGGGLLPLILFGMIMGIGGNIAMGIAVMRLMPNLRLRLLWDRVSWHEIAEFSGFIYLGMIGRMVLYKSSQLLISIFCGVTSVGIFQVSSKVADLCTQATNQYQENISPITGALHKRGKYRLLGQIILGSMCWNSMLAYGTMMVSYILAAPLLEALFKIKDQEVTALSRITLISMFISVALRHVPHRFFVMSERHRLATWIIIAEAGANVVMNLLLLNRYGMPIAIWNSLIIKSVIVIVLIVPYMLKTLHISLWRFLYRMFAVPFAAGVPSMLYLWGMLRFCPMGAWMTVIAGGSGAGLLYLNSMLWLLPPSRRAGYWRKIRARLPF